MATIDEALVRSLLRDRFPDLAGLELRLVDGGWDNRMWRLGEDLALRLPRSERAPALLEREHHWIPTFAAGLPLPVPVPVRLGAPTARFPKSWLVTTWVEGTPADLAPITRPRSAEALAGFLTALHKPAPAGAPRNPDRNVPLAAFAADLDGLSGPLREVWDDALAAPEWDGPAVWCHGDLHVANVVTAEGALSGVVDFGELGAGDPANDLAAAWLLLPDPDVFFKHYDADENTVRRARGWALRRALGLRQIGIAGEEGRTGGKATWRPAAEAALDRLRLLLQ
ncbi:aminoglycoside phosphotransferase family protein [Glycomyces dulcitolivorans]|uniref:aminoglycoside phosphotransferase family protein n=1 Tax=Glycomyces dulcitolivorans TaxID=2200759 RepID=UPI0038CC015B